MKKSSLDTNKKKSPSKKKVSVSRGIQAKANSSATRKANHSFPIVAIGASAGGLEAVTQLLQNLPANTGMAYIYVQHLSPHHESILASLLAKSTKMKVHEAKNRELMQPDNVYVIPPDTEMNILDGHIKLSPRPDIPKVNLPIDILFSSLAERHKDNVIGIILSGSATDGTRGLQAIKYEGGLTFAQNNTAKFESMPKSAIAAGVVDFVLSPKEIALELTRISKHPIVKANGDKRSKEVEVDDKHPDFNMILRYLHKQKGVDFTLYKMNTIKRRIQRRMLLHKIIKLKEYVKLLSEKNEETDLLYNDLLISVTSFFRDADACRYLKSTLLPRLLKSKAPDEALRIWVPACSTGEEAYSIAMMLREIQDSKYSGIPVQIFATDLSTQTINKARIGIYTKQDVETVSPKRLQRFFTRSDGGYRIAQAVRDICVFAPHNILNDPPFSHIDFISCCNLLIYFDTAAQKKTIATFHYALNEAGYLMLGKSETVGSSAPLFSTFNKKLKIYLRKKNSGAGILSLPDTRHIRQAGSPESFSVSMNKNQKNSFPSTNGLDNIINSILLSRYTPASVVINQQMEILQFKGATGLYLSHSTGKASLNILKMARPEIAFELRNAISKAGKTKKPVLKKGIEMNGGRNIVSLEAVPLNAEWNEPLLLIVFTEQQQEEKHLNEENEDKRSSTTKDRKLRKLEEEMAAYRDELRTISHNHEAAMEELQSANEEVVSSNEELRSVNEELETSKEEIQSANEELATTNQELQTRNELLNESYQYSEAIINTVHDPMIILDKDLRIKTANKSFYKKFGVAEEKTEGMFLYDLGNGQWNIPKLRELLDDIIPHNSGFNDFEVEHKFPGIGEKIMLLNARRIVQQAHREQLILLAIYDITDRVARQREEKESLEAKVELQTKIAEISKTADAYIRNVFMQAPVSIVVYKGSSFIVDMINEKGLEMWGTSYEKVINKPLFEISPELREQGMEQILNKVFITGEPFIGNEIPSQYIRNGKKYNGFFDFAIHPVHNLEGTIVGITAIGTDVTQEVEARKKIEKSERLFHFIADSIPHKVWTADSEGNRTYFNQQMLEYTGLSFRDLMNWGWEKIIHPEDLEKTNNRWQESLHSGNSYEIENRLLDKDGNYNWHLSRAVAYKDETGKIEIWIGTHTEIDDIKKLEQRKDEFIKMASHEFKTPITTIKGYLQLLLSNINEKEEKPLPPLLIKSSLITIDKQVVRLTRLISELLDLSRIEAGHLELSKKVFSLNDLLIETVEDILYTNNKHTIDVFHDFGCDIYADRDRIGQVIINLLMNAIKYSPNSGKIEVRIYQPNLNFVSVSIKDHGIGIDKKDLGKIFERFYRVEGKNEETYPGFGIGLFLSSDIIKKHGGDITAESEKKKGSVFTFTLPVADKNK